MLGLEVLVPDVLEVEVAVEAGEIAGETEKHFGERRVDVEVVFTEDIVGGELARRERVGGEGQERGARRKALGLLRTSKNMLSLLCQSGLRRSYQFDSAGCQLSSD
jgi:hypothetical protein